jgi:uracil-DNA glycosylase family 4
MDRLEQMGIQRWRVRRSVSIDNDTMPIPGDMEKAVDNSEEIALSNTAPVFDQSEPISSVNPITDPITDAMAGQKKAAETVPNLAHDSVPAEKISKISSATINTCPPASELSSSDLSRYSWQDLEALLASGTLCEPCRRQNSILGEGDPSADLVIVLDAPSNDDADSNGLLGGRVAKLYDAILQALGRDRQSVYLTTVNKCAASNSPAPRAQCSAIVNRQLALLSPKVVIALGESTAQSVLRTNHYLHELRTTDKQLGADGLPVIASYGLRELLDQPSLKSALWDDLKRCFNYL